MAHSHDTTLTLDIDGMTCSSCVARVEKTLNTVPGVHASVNLTTNSARVSFPPEVQVQQLIDAVAKTGYTASVPQPAAHEGAHQHGGINLGFRLIVSTALTVPLILFAMVPNWQFLGWQWVSLALATPVVFWGGWPFHRATFVNLRHGQLTMDTLITMGTFAAYGWSLYALFFGMAGHLGMTHSWQLFAWNEDPTGFIYFEVAAGVTTFILLGRWLEERSKRAAGAALRALAQLGAGEVTVLREDSEQRIPIDQLAVGDLFLAKPGERIATDGVVVEGRAAVDESALTGEAIPIEKSVGDSVVGATLAMDGRLIIKASTVGENTRLAQLVRLVEDAQLHKAGVQRLADRISAVFVPIVIGIAVATLVLWLLLGGGWAAAFTAAVAVLVIACPCALGLATPVALTVSTGRAAQLGIVISGPEVMERSATITTIVLDKTGTVTAGDMKVLSIDVSPGDRVETVLPRIGAVERLAEHPIARAIASEAERREPDKKHLVSDFITVPGKGVQALVAQSRTFVGTEEWMRENDLVITTAQSATVSAARQRGETVVLGGWDGVVRAIISVGDHAKADSAEAIAELQQMGFETILLTGDHEDAARAVAASVGISQVFAGTSPERKVKVVRELQAQGKRLAMVGDGINDAAALAQADIGLAMGTGTDIAMAASDITLMRGTLTAVFDALQLSRRTLGIIRGNLFWAFAYNVAAIPLAALGFLNPMLAGAAMAFSSLFVVLNSLRLKAFGRRA